jgi:hypothetical protein
MKFFHLLFVLVLATVLLGSVTACSSFSFLQKTEDAIISGAQKYCKEPQANRATLRKAVNQGLAGNATVCVQCKGDAPSPECVAPQ